MLLLLFIYFFIIIIFLILLYLIEMVHLVLLNRPSKPICVANMLVALMYFAVVRGQQIWIDGIGYVIGFYFYFYFFIYFLFIIIVIIIIIIYLFIYLLLLLLLLFFHIGILYFLVQWVSTLRQWMLTRGQHLVHG